MNPSANCNYLRDQVRRLLVLGDIGRQYAVERRPGAALVVVELPHGEAGKPCAVEYLRPVDTRTDRITVLSDIGEPISSIFLGERMQTWNGIGSDRALKTFLTQLDIPENTTIDLETFSPLMLIRSHTGTAGKMHEILVCTRLREVGTLFARVARLASGSDVDLGQLILRASEAAGALHEYVGTDFQLYTRFEPETEIELKIGLEGSVSPWGIASSLAQSVGNGELAGFIPDVGNEHQRWQSAQETFEVTKPTEEAGYFAFISLPSGKYILKRKRFIHDGLRREETFEADVVVPEGDFSAVLTEKYPDMTTRRLPFFTRAKFDVNVESAATGHFFGIEIDEVMVPHYNSTLRQVEIEYHRSRIHEGVDASGIDEEIERLACLVELHLQNIGVAGERTFYSKLSFLRHLVGT